MRCRSPPGGQTLFWVTQRKMPPYPNQTLQPPRFAAVNQAFSAARRPTSFGTRSPINEHPENLGKGGVLIVCQWKRIGALAERGGQSIPRIQRPAMIYVCVSLFVTHWEVIKSKIYSFLFLDTIGGSCSSLCQITTGGGGCIQPSWGLWPTWWILFPYGFHMLVFHFFYELKIWSSWPHVSTDRTDSWEV